MTTISDIARLAGVSTSTVSHVINGTRFVSSTTTEAVQKAIAETGYTVNTLARSLARSSSNTIGIAVPAIGNSYFAAIARAIEVELATSQMGVFLVDTADDVECELRQIKALHQHRVDGVILAPTGKGEASAMHYLHQSGIPTVLIDRLQCSCMDQVGVDNQKGVMRLFDHLVGLGHRDIGFIPGQVGVTTTDERLAGFEAAVLARDLSRECCPSAVACSSIEDAAQAVIDLMQSRPRTTALIGGNNVATLGIMRALNRLSLRVPDDVAVVSFDDFDWADCFEPQLTALRQPAEQIGTMVAQLLLARIAGETSPPRSLQLETEFVIRNSCGAALARPKGVEPRARAG